MNTSKNIERYFGGRTLVLATMHGKDKVLQPILESALGVKMLVPIGLDTDEWGTFSGEVERNGSPLETARRKCEAAHRLTGESLVMASEGSFGAHPVLGFVPANEEWLLLKDFERDFEIKAKVISTSTNFAGAAYKDWDDLIYFVVQTNFPSHGLMVRGAKDDLTEIHKGLRDWDSLKSSFNYFRKRNGQAYIETDMRAMHNPTRMKVIGEVAQKWLEVAHTFCPMCEAPGFAVHHVVKGLPCGTCEAPTKTAKAYIHQCGVCGHKEERSTELVKQKEDPMFCDSCNP